MWTTYWVIVLTFENCLVVKSLQEEKGKLFAVVCMTAFSSLFSGVVLYGQSLRPPPFLSRGEEYFLSPHTSCLCKKTEPIGETGSVYIEIGKIVKSALLAAMRRNADTHIGNAPDAVVAHSLLYSEYLSFP